MPVLLMAISSLPSVSTPTISHCWGYIGPRNCSLGQDFFLKHMRLLFQLRFYILWTLEQLWPSDRGECSSPDTAICLAAVSYFLGSSQSPRPYVPHFQGTHRRLSMWSQWRPSHCTLVLEVAPISNHHFWYKEKKRHTAQLFPKTFS